ncbi:MFS transporter [Streptomyces sp. NPDC056568]|uniref:MFS transporter n=1 Tax=Streptomyces sp. NPDC056568 TaxID=3345866 RepID=UPI0036D1FF12
MGGSAGSAAGPVAGGLLSQADGRLIFLVNVPVGLVAALLAARARRSPRAAKAPFDWTGQVSAALAMGALTLAAIEAGSAGLTAWRVLAALAPAVVSAGMFVASQARGRSPVVGSALLRERTMVLSSAIGFALNVGFYGMIFLLSLYLQQAGGMSPLATGPAFVPMTLLTAAVSPTAASLAARFGARMPVITGQAAMAVGLVVLALVPATAPTWLPVAAMIPVGAGGSLAVPALTSLLLDHVAPEKAGTATGVLNTARQMGGALAVAVFGGLIARPGHRETGLDTALCLAAATVVITTAASFLLRPATRV